MSFQPSSRQEKDDHEDKDQDKDQDTDLNFQNKEHDVEEQDQDDVVEESNCEFAIPRARKLKPRQFTKDPFLTLPLPGHDIHFQDENRYCYQNNETHAHHLHPTCGAAHEKHPNMRRNRLHISRRQRHFSGSLHDCERGRFGCDSVVGGIQGLRLQADE